MSIQVEAVRAWLKGAQFQSRNRVVEAVGLKELCVHGVINRGVNPKAETLEKFERAALLRRQALLEELLLVDRVLQK